MGCVVRNIDYIEGTNIGWTTGNIVNSKFCRNYNNKVASCAVIHGNESNELSKHKVKNCIIANGRDASIDAVVYDNCTFTGFGCSKIVCTNCTINSNWYLGDQLYFYDCVFENTTDSTEEMTFRFNKKDATRVYENCTFKGKTFFASNNAFNSGQFKNCTFEDLRLKVALMEETDKSVITFDNCKIASTADNFIHMGQTAGERNYGHMIFNNCEITHTGNSFFYLYGKPIGNSSVEFNDCTINKDTGTFLSGVGKLADFENVALSITLKNTKLSKELDVSYAEDQSKVKVIYE